MKKLILIFGLIAGLIITALMSLSLTFVHSFENGEVTGYLSMIIAFSTIFVAVKSYRDNQLKGSITFGKAFQIGLYITLVTSALYVIWWMIYSNTVYTTFMDDYTSWSLEKLKASGASSVELEDSRRKMEEFKEMYKNPIIKIGMTFMEIFPVGLIVSLISAAVLRKKEILPVS